MTDPADHTLELVRKLHHDVTAGFNGLDQSLGDLTVQARITNAQLAVLVQHKSTTQSTGPRDR